MPNPFEQGDELKKQYLEKALHANDEAVNGAKFTDLMDENSSVYKDTSNSESKQKPKIEERPKFDADGFPIIEQVHTYKEDLTGIVQSDKLSLSRIAMMEDKSRNAQPIEEKPKEKGLQNRIFVIVGTLLVLMGIGIVGGVLMIMSKNKEEEAKIINTPKERYIIFAEKKEDFDITKSTKTEIGARIKTIKDKFKEEDSIMEISPVIIENNSTRRSTLLELVEKIGMRIPNELTRTLSSKYFFGFYSKKGKTDPFIIMYTSSYDIAYPSLLNWEGYMQDDFDWLYNTKPKIGTTTNELLFKDRIVLNKDARSFEDSEAKSAFFYAFIDEKTIIFASNSDTVRKVIDRIREAKFQ